MTSCRHQSLIEPTAFLAPQTHFRNSISIVPKRCFSEWQLIVETEYDIVFPSPFKSNLMMQISAQILWQRNEEPFLDNRYSRNHQWKFDGGAVYDASASPHIVPPPLSDEKAVDPEEAFVASISSCHMLWFLSIAAKNGFVIERYDDEAIGVMAKNDVGKRMVANVTLRPKIAWKETPSTEEVQRMHDVAHEECFIANSVKTKIVIEVNS